MHDSNRFQRQETFSDERSTDDRFQKWQSVRICRRRRFFVRLFVVVEVFVMAVVFVVIRVYGVVMFGAVAGFVLVLVIVVVVTVVAVVAIAFVLVAVMDFVLVGGVFVVLLFVNFLLVFPSTRKFKRQRPLCLMFLVVQHLHMYKEVFGLGGYVAEQKNI